MSMSDREHIYGTIMFDLHQIFVILLWQRCDTLWYFRFLDDVIFAYNGQYGGMYTVSNKKDTKLIAVTKSNLKQFSKFIQ